MNRRDFLKAASGVAGGAAAAGAATPVAASDEETTTTSGGTTTGSGGNATATGTTTGGGGGGGGTGPTKEVVVGPGGSLVFEPDSLTIAPGTTVRWVWDSDDHNIVVENQPEGAGWEGTPGSDTKTYDDGYTYSHTFQTVGTYDYYCQPHRSAGMVASITVAEGGGAAQEELDPEHMGVPFQAHYVGIATILAIFSSLMFTFYVLKYGESPHSSSPNRE